MDSRDHSMNRRQFVGGLAAASAFTIIPRRVLGGPGFIPPSDQLVVAQVGCGMQSQRQVNTGMVAREDLQFVAVCDPNRDSQNYVDWSRHGTRDRVRRFLEEPSWGEGDTGIRAGREVAKEIMETYYAKNNRASEGIRSYADHRELLEKETDIDAVVAITPDHQHAAISLATLKAGKAIIAHKPVANVWDEARRTVDQARQSNAVTHLLAYSDHPDYHKLDAMLKSGAIGPVREIHNWSVRPVWPQGWMNYFTEEVPVPDGFDWELWLGPEQFRPYHPMYTSAVYRGWFAYGAGCLGDMGNYSLWQPHRMLDLGVPVSVEANPAHEVVVVEGVCDSLWSEVAYPMASSIHFRHAAKGDRPAISVYWWDGTQKPATPAELLEKKEDMPAEGMMFVGDDGKILCDFRGENPRFLSGGNNESFGASSEENDDHGDDEWIAAIKEGRKSAGSYENVSPLAEATCLGNLALRFHGQRLDWDASAGQFTNVPEANQYLRRDYRQGFEV